MADEKLVDLTELTSPNGADITYVIDKSDTTDSPEGTSKKMRLDAYANPSGVARYDELTDLPGTGVATTSYKVTADPTPSNNGFYSWDGAAYTKDTGLYGGTITEGDTDAVSGETVYDINTLVTNDNLANPIFILDNTFVANTTGILETFTDYKTIKIAVTPGESISFGNFTIDSHGNYSWYLGDTPLDAVTGATFFSSGAELHENITVPASVDTLYIAISRAASPDFAFTMANVGSTLLPYVASLIYTKEIANFEVLAKTLSNDNIVPDPTTSSNAVNKGYFDLNALLESDLTIDYGDNLARDTNILDNTYVNNTTFELQTIEGFKTISIPVTPGEVISYGNFTIDTLGNSTFYLGETFIAAGVTHADVNLPIQNLTVPATVDTLYIAIARSLNVPADYAETMVNVGSTLLPYTTPVITKIIDVEIAGADNANAAIQDTDVTFASVTTAGLSLDLPTGSTEPGGLEIGDAWVDTDDSTIKVKLT